MNTRQENLLCPCNSGRLYQDCCEPFHSGKALPDTAQKLMRSRYSAYALNLPEYIMDTTHPHNIHFSTKRKEWGRDIQDFCQHTQFKKLEILDVEEKDTTAYVTFYVHLFQGAQDVSFTEKSYFENSKGKWMYVSGEVTRGRASS